MADFGTRAGGTTATTRHDTDRDDARRARTFATIVAAAFVVIGILGFVPGITENLDDIEFAGHESRAQLLGFFQVSVLHNLVHLLFGVVGFAAARTARTARTFLIGGGAVYLVLWVYGLIVDKASDANFVPVDRADDWLHFALGVGMIGLGVLASRAPASRLSSGR